MTQILPWLDHLPIIAGPIFYLVACPAVLLMGLSKSGFLNGLSTLVVPLLSLVTSVTQAAAVMLPLLLVMDGVGIQQLWLDRDRAVLRLLLPVGLLGTLAGVLLFGVLSTRTVVAVLGGLTLLFLAQRLLFPPRADAPPPSRLRGNALGTAAGFTSFIAHTGGPPINAYILPLRLSPVRFTATAAVFFATLNLAKWIPYAWLGLIDFRNMATALVLMPIAPIGVCGAHVVLSRRLRQLAPGGQQVAVGRFGVANIAFNQSNTRS